MTAQAEDNPNTSEAAPQQSLVNQCLFSKAAQSLVARMLNGKVEIRDDDIRLETAEGSSCAILISERLSCHPEFKKMWTETSCISLLKELARQSLQQ